MKKTSDNSPHNPPIRVVEGEGPGFPKLSCDEAAGLLKKLEEGKIGQLEALFLGLHLSDNDFEHKKSCPRNDESIAGKLRVVTIQEKVI